MSAPVAPEGEPVAQRGAVVAAFAAIYLLWGATFLALRWAVAEIPPLATIAIRCAGGAGILFLWAAWRGRLTRPTGAEWRVATLAGILLFAGCHAGLAWAEQRVSSGQAALLLTAIPLWLVVIDASVRRRPPPARVLAGLSGGVAGVAVLVSGDGRWIGEPVDRAVLLASGFLWAAGSLVARHGARPRSAVQSTAMQLAVGAVVVTAGSLALGELDGWRPGEISLRGLASLAFLIVCGTSIAFAAYTWLLRVTTAAAVGTYAFVNPLIAVGLAWVVGDEPATPRTALAATLIVGAVVLARRSRRGENL